MHWIDPDCLPEFSGEVQQFIVNTRGEIDGMILWSDKLKSMLVHTPPHMAADIESTIQIGEEICVRGVRPRGADIIVAVALIAQGGLALVDHGPPKGHEDKEEQKLPDREPKKEPCETEGKVRLSLFGPKGELRGAVLDNGTIIRVGHKEATNLSEFLRPDFKSRGAWRWYSYQAWPSNCSQRDWAEVLGAQTGYEAEPQRQAFAQSASSSA